MKNIQEIRQGMKVQYRGETGYVLAFYQDKHGYNLNMTMEGTKYSESFVGLDEEEVNKIKILES